MFAVVILVITLLITIGGEQYQGVNGASNSKPFSYKITTIAGGVVGPQHEEEGIQSFGTPTSIALMGNGISSMEDIIIVDSSNNAIKKLTFDANRKKKATVSILAGCSGSTLWNTTKAIETKIEPKIVTVSPKGDIYFAEVDGIYKIDKLGSIYRIAKNSWNVGSLSLENPQFYTINNIHYYQDGDNEYILVLEDFEWKIIDLSNRIIFVYRHRFGRTNAVYITFNSTRGDLGAYFAGNNYIVKMEQDGNFTRVAGNDFLPTYVNPKYKESAQTTPFHLNDDNIPAINARVNPNSLFVTSEGEILFTEIDTHRVRKIDANGIITTIAGSWINEKENNGFYGEGIDATEAILNNPTQVIQSKFSKEIFIADTGNNRVRKIGLDGKISTVFGNGKDVYLGEGVHALQAQMKPSFIQVSSKNGKDVITLVDTLKYSKVRVIDENLRISTIVGAPHKEHQVQLFIPEDEIDGYQANTTDLVHAATACHRTKDGEVFFSRDNDIYVVKNDGFIKKMVGTDFSGDNGLATNAVLHKPSDVFYSKESKKIYIADKENHRIRVVDKDGIITTLIGHGYKEELDPNNPLSKEMVLLPNGVFERDGYLYFTEHAYVKKINLQNKHVTIIGGNGQVGFIDGQIATNCSVNLPGGLFVSKDHTVFFSDSLNGKIRQIKDGIMTTIAPNAFVFPSDVKMNSKGELIVADLFSQNVKLIGVDGNVTTLFSAMLPNRLAINDEDDIIFTHGLRSTGYISKYSYTDDVITTIAGTKKQKQNVNTPLDMEFSTIIGLSIGESQDELYFVESGLSKIRHLKDGVVTKVAGGIGNNMPALQGKLDKVSSFLITPENEMYITDFNHHIVRKVNKEGIISTVIGMLDIEGLNNETDVLKAWLDSPSCIARSVNGDLFICDSKNRLIRKVSNNVISNLIGDRNLKKNAIPGMRGNETTLVTPQSIAISPKGDYLVFTDIAGGIFKLSLLDENAIVERIAGMNGIYGFNGDGDAFKTSVSVMITSLAFSNDGVSIYFADGANDRIRKLEPYCEDGYYVSYETEMCEMKISEPEKLHSQIVEETTHDKLDSTPFHLTTAFIICLSVMTVLTVAIIAIVTILYGIKKRKLHQAVLSENKKEDIAHLTIEDQVEDLEA